MKNNIKKFFESILYKNKITKDQIHHVEVFYSCPDTWYGIVHKKGDKKKKSLFRKLFNLEAKVYSESIVYNRYTNKEIPINEFVQGFKNSTYIIKENDQDYPIWFNNGIQIYYKDKYNNIKCSTIFYITDYKITDIEEIVTEINCELYKDTLEFFGYRHIDLPKLNAVRYTVTDREPVKLNCIAEASLDIMYSLDRDKIIDHLKKEIIRGFTNSDDFKSLVKYNINNNGETISMNGYIEILKDR